MSPVRKGYIPWNKDTGIFGKNRDKIIKWYLEDKLSGVIIQTRLKTKNKKVYDFLRRNGIKVRTRSEARIGLKPSKESIRKANKTKKERGTCFPVWEIAKEYIKRRKGKTYEEIYGEDKAKIIKNKISKGNLGKIGKPISSKQKLLHSKRMKGKCAGEKNYFWKGGIFKSKYPKEFNGYLKLKVRIRDNYTCQECYVNETKLQYKLHVHHIDFNKDNNYINNLISLCRKCHGCTQFKKKDWIKYYQNKIKENKNVTSP